MRNQQQKSHSRLDSTWVFVIGTSRPIAAPSVHSAAKRRSILLGDAARRC